MEASDINLSWRKLVEEVTEDRNRLRASHKELLEALEEYLNDHEDYVDALHGRGPAACGCKLCDKARAAISNAKGGN